MFSLRSKKVLQNKAFRSLVATFIGAALVTSLSGCGPVEALRAAYEGEAFPELPAPEINAYVLDLSGSTFPAAQLEALSSGITELVAGRSLGNPFAQTPTAPRGLSIQFVTKNSAQAPRILLVSTGTSKSLYEFIKEKTPNLEGAIQLWDGLVSARTAIWQDAALESNPAECVDRVIEMLGRQQLLPEALQYPAKIICQDAMQTASSFDRLESFISNPGIEMGSDVKGAFETSLKNLMTAKAENPTARITLVVASDLIDEISLDHRRRLKEKDESIICDMAKQDAGTPSFDYTSVNVVIVGARNSKANLQVLDQVQAYWTCYLNQIGITNVTEQSDLSGF